METLEPMVLPARPRGQNDLRDSGVAAAGKRGGWLQVLSHLDPSYGGLSAVVPRLAKQLGTQEGLSVRTAAFCSPDEHAFAARQSIADLSLWPMSRSSWASGASLRTQFRDIVSSSDGVHIHGLWESSTLMAASAARRSGVPYVISAHGMLERWALQNKRVKKVIYAALFERRNVNGAACVHALTHAEADDYRRFGYDGPIAVIPNGVEANTSATPDEFLTRFPQAQGKRLLLFLGRIHFKKGVDLLLQAWEQIADENPDALLVLAGPDSEGTLSRAMDTANTLDVRDRVLFTGMLDDTLKWSALAAASYFVLPSYSEGLSVAVLEAMSMGVPLILSEQCNLPQVQQSGAGWQVQDERQVTRTRPAGSLRRHTHGTPACCALKRAGSPTVEFSWDSVTERMAGLYRWVAGGPVPQNVELLEAAR